MWLWMQDGCLGAKYILKWPTHVAAQPRKIIMTALFEDPVPDILSDNFYEVIIVGGGTCGLAVAARLCEDTPGSIYTDDEHQRFHWLKQRGSKVATISKSMKKLSKYTSPVKLLAEHILVLDAVSDTFLGQWDNQFRSCQIPVLRSPMFFHPDPATIDAMIAYAHIQKREKELMEIPNVVGREYSKHQHKRTKKKHCNKCPAPTPNSKTHDRDGIIDINMRDWRDYYRPSTKFFRDFCQDLIDRYRLGSRVVKDEVASIRYGDVHIYDLNIVRKAFIVTTQSGKVYASGSCVVASGHRGKINYPIGGLKHAGAPLEFACHSTHIFNGEVAFPHPQVPRQNGHIVIVGGGLTSAQLAHVACLQGYKVTLVVRGGIKIKHFDFHLDWVTKYKNVKKSSFYMLDTDEERLQLILDAREGGLVNPEYHVHLNNHVTQGNLTIRKHTTIDHGVVDGGKWHLQLATKNCGHFCSHLPAAPETLVADYVCCATGIRANIETLPFMAPILQKYPIDIVGGLPCLTDHLQWCEELPLFMVGKNASLRIGPTSANLDGARTGAERVGWKIQEDRLRDTSPLTLDTVLELAAGKLNWYSLLQEA